MENNKQITQHIILTKPYPHCDKNVQNLHSISIELLNRLQV